MASSGLQMQARRASLFEKGQHMENVHVDHITSIVLNGGELELRRCVCFFCRETAATAAAFPQRYLGLFSLYLPSTLLNAQQSPGQEDMELVCLLSLYMLTAN